MLRRRESLRFDFRSRRRVLFPSRAWYKHPARSRSFRSRFSGPNSPFRLTTCAELLPVLIRSVSDDCIEIP